jgi:hypothetical protein
MESAPKIMQSIFTINRNIIKPIVTVHNLFSAGVRLHLSGLYNYHLHARMKKRARQSKPAGPILPETDECYFF